MKKIEKTILVVSLAAIGLLGSCTKTGTSSGGNKTSSSGVVDNGDFTITYKNETFKVDDSTKTATVSVGDNAAILDCQSTSGVSTTFTYESSDESVLLVSSTGKISAYKVGTATVTVKSAGGKQIVITFTVTATTVSSSGVSYASVSYDEKSRILASLEKYAVDNYLTGITIFSDGSKMAYNTRYVPQPKSYINGYGWGTTREGVLTSELKNALSKKTTYYNIGTTSLPAQANAMNASGSDVSTVYDYISSAYFATRMNQSADGYEWYNSLATDSAPIAVEEPTLNDDGTVKSYGAVISDTDARHDNNRRWRIHLRSGVKYRTGSTLAFTSKYDKTEVKLEDYLTPLKFMLTAWNGQYRGAELTDGISGFTGAATYYGKTASNSTGDSSAIWSDEDWNKIMGGNIFTGHDDSGDFIEFNLLENCTQFYAMYYLSSSLYSPLPADFIKFWGGKYLGQSPDASSVPAAGRACTPVDTMLSTGPYYIESWDTNLILFKKNEDYFYTEDVFTDALGTTTRKVYNLDGIAYNKVEDSSKLKSEFLAGSLDSYSPKPEDLKTGGDFSAESGSNDKMGWRIYETKGSSNFKLNVNASTEKNWLKRFGPNGTNNQVSGYTNTWTKLNKDLDGKTPETACKPYMSNIHFLNFLSFSINRKEICEARGSTPTQEYFSDNYLIDPETGVSYNSTTAHKAVLADRYNDTYGFNETYAKSELRKAFEEVIIPLGENKAFSSKSGGSSAGTKNNPWIVPIDMEWMNTTDSKDYSDVFKYVKQFFADVSKEYDGNYELDIKETSGSSDYQQVYTLMKQGQFDLGFGSISGNSLNPLNFLEVLKSDNSSGFTLNWGPDTSVVGSGLYSGSDSSKNTIVYDGKTWSFDGLWSAADRGTLLTNTGSVAKVENASSKFSSYAGVKYEKTDATAKSVTYRLSFKQLIEAGASSIKFKVSNSSAETNWKNYIINGTETGYETLTADSDGIVNLVLGNGFNRSQGSTTDDARIVTLTISYTAVLKSTQADGTIQNLTKEFTSTMNLATFVGVTVDPSK